MSRDGRAEVLEEVGRHPMAQPPGHGHRPTAPVLDVVDRAEDQNAAAGSCRYPPGRRAPPRSRIPRARLCGRLRPLCFEVEVELDQLHGVVRRELTDDRHPGDHQPCDHE